MKNIIKNILFSVLIITVFFAALELAQRIRYALRYRAVSWMLYGVDDYIIKNPSKMQERYKVQDDQYEEQLKKTVNPDEIVSTVDGLKVFKFEYDKKENYKKLIPGDYILNKNALMHINSSGFRGVEISGVKTMARLFMMGGSSTLGADNSDNKTYPYLTQDVLKKRYGKDIEVINGGIGGVNISEIYHLLEKEVFDLSPDMVTIYSGYNNWNVKSREGIGWRSVLFHIKEFFIGKSLLFCTINEKIQLLKNQNCSALYYNPGVAEAILQDQKIWSDFRLYLEKICISAKRRNIRVVLITQPLYLVDRNPDNFWEDKKLWEKHYEMTNAIIKDVAKEQGVLCIDVASHFDRLDPDHKRELFVDVVHLTDKGNMAVAEVIAKNLALLLP